MAKGLTGPSTTRPHDPSRIYGEVLTKLVMNTRTRGADRRPGGSTKIGRFQKDFPTASSTSASPK
jgi:hypothetical protein